jgi:phosphoribosylanthranilate isomerase
MSAIKVKICGITNFEDARASIDAGCDALGFVFYKKSPRYITPDKAKDIIKELPENVIKVGVFVNAKERTIRRIAKLCHLDILQFHGSESPEFCARFRGHKIIKAFRIKDSINLKNILGYSTFAYLFDTFVKFKMGGTGKNFDWKLLANLADIKQPIFLSGGLTINNVKEAIKVARPNWVDVSSSVEIKAGKKCFKKVKDFIETAKKV